MRKWMPVVILVGWMGTMFATTAWSAEALAKAYQTTFTSQEDGITLTLKVDMTRLRYEPSGSGTLSGAGMAVLGEPGRWALPEAMLEVVLPDQMDLASMEIRTAPPVIKSSQDMSIRRIPWVAHDGCSKPVTADPPRYPEQLVEWGPRSYHHGVQTQRLLVHPAQIDPATGQLTVTSEVVIRLSWKSATKRHERVVPFGTQGAAARMKTELKQSAVNGADLDRLYATASSDVALIATTPPVYTPKSPTGRLEGVIICPQQYTQAVQLLADEKTRAGHPWDVVTHEWIAAQPAYRVAPYNDLAAAIRAFLIEAYQRHGLEQVFFVGDPPRIGAYHDLDLLSGTSTQPTQSLGYYTNLDSGEHDRVSTDSTTFTVYVYFDEAGWSSRRREVTYEVIPDGSVSDRCRLATLTPWQGITVTYNPFFDRFSDFFQRPHPELAGQEIWFWIEQLIFQRTCDPTPELLGGILPIPSASGLGATALGLYRNKLHRYQEPVAPERVLRSFFSGTEQSPGTAVWSDKALPILQWLVEGVGRFGDFGCDRADSSTVLRELVNNPFVLKQPWGLKQTWSSGYGGIGDAGESFPVYGGASFTGFWRYGVTDFVWAPEGPVVGIHGGQWGCFAPGGRMFDNVRSYSGGFSFWNPVFYPAIPRNIDFHHDLIVGDPSVRLWTAVPTRLVVTHPTALPSTGQIPVVVRDQAGQPVSGASVVLSKRRLGGAWAYYQRQVTSSGGQVVFQVGTGGSGEEVINALPILGTGVLSVEIEGAISVPGSPEYYPYHGMVALPGNRPPVFPNQLPTGIPLITEMGSWVVLDASQAYDPDGDPIYVTFGPSASPEDRFRDERVTRRFFPEGVHALRVNVTDGVQTLSQTISLTVTRGLDVVPPVSEKPVLIVPPRRGLVAVPVQVAFNAAMGWSWGWPPAGAGILQFNAKDPIDLLVPSAPRGLSGWAFVSLTSNDPTLPQPPSITSMGTTLWIAAESNSDATLRQYTVMIRLTDLVGNTSEVSGEIVIAPVGSYRVDLTVVEPQTSGPVVAFEDAAGPPLLELYEPAYGWTLRAWKEPAGFFKLYIPQDVPGVPFHQIAVSKGGWQYRQDLRRGHQLLVNPWVNLYPPQGGQVSSWELPVVGFVRPTGNQPPIARAPALTLAPTGTWTPAWLDARQSSDPDQDLLTYTWTWTMNGQFHRQVGPLVWNAFPAGTTQVTLTVSDGDASNAKVFPVTVTSSAPAPAGSSE